MGGRDRKKEKKKSSRSFDTFELFIRTAQDRFQSIFCFFIKYYSTHSLLPFRFPWKTSFLAQYCMEFIQMKMQMGNRGVFWIPILYPVLPLFFSLQNSSYLSDCVNQIGKRSIKLALPLLLEGHINKTVNCSSFYSHNAAVHTKVVYNTQQCKLSHHKTLSYFFYSYTHLNIYTRPIGGFLLSKVE